MKITDFNSIVEGIMKSGNINPGSPTPSVLASEVPSADPLAPYVLDTENVRVPDVFVESLLGKSSKNVEEQEEEVETVEQLSEEKKVAQLVSELTQVVSKARKIIQELITCGMIGVNMAGKPKAKKKVKYGYTQSSKRS